MRRRPLRIVNPWHKALVVVAFFAVFVAVGQVLPYELSIVASVVYAIVQSALIYGITRVFRVREEPIVTPRAWWRATGRPTAGFVIGGLWLFSLIVGIADVAFGGLEIGVVDLVLGLVSTSALAAFYVHSSIRLLRVQRDRTLLPTRRSDV